MWLTPAVLLVFFWRLGLEVRAAPPWLRVFGAHWHPLLLAGENNTHQKNAKQTQNTHRRDFILNDTIRGQPPDPWRQKLKSVLSQVIRQQPGEQKKTGVCKLWRQCSSSTFRWWKILYTVTSKNEFIDKWLLSKKRKNERWKPFLLFASHAKQ